MYIESRTLHLKEGIEGPRHDPYSYSKYTVEVNDTEYTLHMGLGCYLDIDGKRVEDNKEKAIARFEELTGIPAHKFEEYYYRVHPYFEDPMGSPSKYI